MNLFTLMLHPHSTLLQATTWMFTRYLRHARSSSVVLAVPYGRSPSVWAGRAPYFWTPWSRWIRCAASSSSGSAELCLRCSGQVLVGNWQEWSFIRICPSVWITSLAVWSAPGLARTLNWNTEETPNMRKPRNFAKSGVYFQHSQSLSYLLL